MTIKDRIEDYLREFGPATDAKIAQALGVLHQQVNQRCRAMEDMGHLTRFRGPEGLIENSLASAPSPKVAKRPYGVFPIGRPWCWEGNVQSCLVAYLVRQGWKIDGVADTASKARGKDIAASFGQRVLWVSVKGYPKGTPRTNPSTQAGHWFGRAVFDLVRYRTESATAELAIGIPSHRVTYRNLASRASWVFRALPARVYWVDESGSVQEQAW